MLDNVLGEQTLHVEHLDSSLSLIRDGRQIRSLHRITRYSRSLVTMLFMWPLQHHGLVDLVIHLGSGASTHLSIYSH